MKNLRNEIPFFDLIDTVYNSILITNGKLTGPENPKILYVNKGFEKLTGYSSKEVIGKTPRILQGKLTNRPILNLLKEKLKKGEFFEGNTVNYKKDGSYYYVEWNISPIKNELGEIEYYFCVQKDITDSVKYEQLLQESIKKETLLRQEKEKTIEEQSKHVALGEIIDSVAHQWKQPLSIVRLEIDFLTYSFNDNILDEKEILNFKNKTFRQLDHLSNTLDEFRDFLRKDKEKTIFKASKAVDSVFVLIKDEFLKSTIELVVYEKNDFEIFGYENEFKHVLINIMNNTKDALKKDSNIKGKIEITIDKNQILISDNAGGIPENIIENIFDYNYTTKEKIGGTGLGLYMSKKIIEKIDGKIEIENTNIGVNFILNLMKNNGRK